MRPPVQGDWNIRPKESAVWGLAVLLAAGPGGCGATGLGRTPGPHASHQGLAWEVVLPAQPTDPPAWLIARRDDALNVHPPAGLLDSGAWPARDAPGLQHARRLLVLDRPQYVIYFAPPRRPWHDHLPWWDMGIPDP